MTALRNIKQRIHLYDKHGRPSGVLESTYPYQVGNYVACDKGMFRVRSITVDEDSKTADVAAQQDAPSKTHSAPGFNLEDHTQQLIKLLECVEYIEHIDKNFLTGDVQLRHLKIETIGVIGENVRILNTTDKHDT